MEGAGGAEAASPLAAAAAAAATAAAAPAAVGGHTLVAPDAWRAAYAERLFVSAGGGGGALRLAVYRTAAGAAAADAPVVLLLHGANYSAVSFNLLVQKLSPVAAVVAFDMRGHGGSDDAPPLPPTGAPSAAAPQQLVADSDALVRDCVAVVRAAIVPRYGGGAKVVLVGHSLGAALATHVAAAWEGVPRDGGGALPALAGLVLIDAQEGTALAGLAALPDLLARMPHAWAAPEAAVEWVLSAGVLRLPASARATVPAHLEWLPAGGGGGVGWRAWPFMVSTGDAWRGGVEGTNARLLAAPCPKMLLLPDADRLDRELIVAQMQGKYALRLVAGVGHVMHEDAPDKVAEAILQFLSRARLTADLEAHMLAERLERSRAAAARLASSSHPTAPPH